MKKNRWLLKRVFRPGVAFLCILAMLSGLIHHPLPISGADQGKEPLCGQIEHIHTSNCYEDSFCRVLTCVYENSDSLIIHVHEANCYDKENLVCPLKAAFDLADFREGDEHPASSPSWDLLPVPLLDSMSEPFGQALLKTLPGAVEETHPGIVEEVLPGTVEESLPEASLLAEAENRRAIEFHTRLLSQLKPGEAEQLLDMLVRLADTVDETCFNEN